MGYVNSSDEQVEDGKSAHTTYLMTKDFKVIAGVHIKIDI